MLIPRLSLFLGYSSFYVHSEPEYSYKLYSYKKKAVYINVSSVRNKLEALSEFVCSQEDFLTISETKLDSSFPTAQFNLRDLELHIGKIKLRKVRGYLYM